MCVTMFCGFVVIGNSVAIWFLLSLEILHFDWLVNWLGPMVIEGTFRGIHRRMVYIHTYARQTRQVMFCYTEINTKNPFIQFMRNI